MGCGSEGVRDGTVVLHDQGQLKQDQLGHVMLCGRIALVDITIHWTPGSAVYKNPVFDHCLVQSATKSASTALSAPIVFETLAV